MSDTPTVDTNDQRFAKQYDSAGRICGVSGDVGTTAIEASAILQAEIDAEEAARADVCAAPKKKIQYKFSVTGVPEVIGLLERVRAAMVAITIARLCHDGPMELDDVHRALEMLGRPADDAHCVRLLQSARLHTSSTDAAVAVVKRALDEQTEASHDATAQITTLATFDGFSRPTHPIPDIQFVTVNGTLLGTLRSMSCAWSFIEGTRGDVSCEDIDHAAGGYLFADRAERAATTPGEIVEVKIISGAHKDDITLRARVVTYEQKGGTVLYRFDRVSTTGYSEMLERVNK